MTFRPVISSQADLEAAWRFLMQPLGFSGESLWFLLVEPDGIAVPSITQIEDAIEPPDDTRCSRWPGTSRPSSTTSTCPAPVSPS
jgi:hypothetical protein